jgi:alkylation response protein AidB-like acyl-CoA dehydrogenase
MTATAIAREAPASDAEAILAARRFAGAIAPGAVDRDRAGTVPVAEMAELDASGLLAITVPRAYGGTDVSMVTLAEVIRTIAAVDPAIAQVPQGHFLMVDVLAVCGTERQRRLLFGEVLPGGRLGNALAERGGRHAQDLQTRLRDGRRLDGRKYYCTGAISARWIGVSALDDDGQLVLAFVERDAEGVQLTDDWNVMGQRATVSRTPAFDDVRADPALVIHYQPTGSTTTSATTCSTTSCRPTTGNCRRGHSHDPDTRPGGGSRHPRAVPAHRGDAGRRRYRGRRRRHQGQR